jgi:hypothetical protein
MFSAVFAALIALLMRNLSMEAATATRFRACGIDGSPLLFGVAERLNERGKLDEFAQLTPTLERGSNYMSLLSEAVATQLAHTLSRARDIGLNADEFIVVLDGPNVFAPKASLARKRRETAEAAAQRAIDRLSALASESISKSMRSAIERGVKATLRIDRACAVSVCRARGSLSLSPSLTIAHCAHAHRRWHSRWRSRRSTLTSSSRLSSR